MSVSSISAVVILVCRAYSPDGALLCETANVQSQPTTIEECIAAADVVRETWNQIKDYAEWNAWAVACPGEHYGLAVSKPASLFRAVEGN